MAKTSQNATIYAGTKIVLRYTGTNQDDTPFDFSAVGLVVRWTLSLFQSGTNVPLTADPLIEKTTGGADVTVDPGGAGTDVVDVQLNTADTDNTFIGPRYAELSVVDSGGEEVIVATGTLTFLPNVENA